ncbi:hypothetical protein Fot_35989 [Forsythia ovata]|uniref:Uncharacterized protein n=1 Tax=Forsythia ovata TaxID=205694 RepID=A0ABD1SNV1_9LAMI
MVPYSHLQLSSPNLPVDDHIIDAPHRQHFMSHHQLQTFYFIFAKKPNSQQLHYQKNYRKNSNLQTTLYAVTIYGYSICFGHGNQMWIFSQKLTTPMGLLIVDLGISTENAKVATSRPTIGKRE